MVRGFLLIFLISSTASSATRQSKYSAECALQAVASHMGVALRNDIPVPRVLHESETTLAEFLELAKANLGDFKPDTILNMYAFETNVIFLKDDESNYRNGRAIEDSLAHELVHFIQYKYRGADFLNDHSDMLEIEAITEQNWFRETFIATDRSPCPEKK